MEERGEVVREWRWDLDEMKNAGAMDLPQAAQASQYPIISDFTAVNPPRPKGATGFANDGNVASALKPAALAKTPKRRKTRSSSTLKPGKIAGTKKSKRSKKAEELLCRDISKDLSRTKPTASVGNGALAKTTAPSEELLSSEPMRDAYAVRDALAHSQELEDVGPNHVRRRPLRRPDYVRRRPLTLANPHRIIYHENSGTDSPRTAEAEMATESTLKCYIPRTAEAEMATESTLRCDIPRTAEAEMATESTLRCDIPHTASDMSWVHASAQHDNDASGDNQVYSQQALYQFNAPCAEPFNSDEIFRDQDEAEELTMNEKDPVEFVQSVAPIEDPKRIPPHSRQRQAFIRDTSMFEGPNRHVLTDNTMQASSDNRRGSGNANLQRHQENDDCFDDDDLDKDLMVVLEDGSISKSPHPGYEDHCATVSIPRDSINQETYHDSFVISDAPSPPSSYTLIDQFSEQAVNTRASLGEGIDCFDDDELEIGLIDLTADRSETVLPQTPLRASKTPPPSPKLQWMSPKSYTPKMSAQPGCSSTSDRHEVLANEDVEHSPFIRPPFPTPIRDRSPILGLTNNIVLRTCFRIGEALNAAAVASRTNTDAIIELYARIVLSEREINGGFKQFFQFGDLFTNKPPYLSGTYSLWKGVNLWNLDSKPFLGEEGKGKMARAIGRIKRCEQGGGCEMVILSIWEVDWEDVEVAKGIVCS